jgi:hypothetical protein
LKLYIQWSTRTFHDWIQVESSAWDGLSGRPEPQGTEEGGHDDVPGWIFDLNVQGVMFGGYDHYAVEEAPPDGIRVTVWNDDPAEFPDGQKYARAWTFLPPAPDARFGGAMNTRQSQIIYAQPLMAARLDGQPNVRGWSEFVPPVEEVIRHGIWVPKPVLMTLWKDRRHVGWRDWL